MRKWIEHDGSGTPDLPHETYVEVRFSDGCTVDNMTVGFWHSKYPDSNNFLWKGRSPEWADIVAYRVVTSADNQ